MRERWRKRLVVALVLYIVGMAWWAFRPSVDSVPMLVPPADYDPTKGPPSASFRCVPVFGGAQKAAVPLKPVPYKLDGTPCDDRSTHQVLVVVDVALAAAGLVVLRRRGGAGVDEPVAQEVPAA
ncbi:MAG TPA: hypothetical protein VFJ85_19650 [Acidimicrobiales bacterium]|nr:hypothetical protein [Acidimicrobiales bacterium]